MAPHLPPLAHSIPLLSVLASFPPPHLCRIPKVRRVRSVIGHWGRRSRRGGRRGAATETFRGTPPRPRPLGRGARQVRLPLDGVAFVSFRHRSLAEAIAAGRKARRRHEDFLPNSSSAAPSRKDKRVIKQGLGSAIHALSNAFSLALTQLRDLQTVERSHAQHATAAEEAARQEKRARVERRDLAATRRRSAAWLRRRSTSSASSGSATRGTGVRCRGDARPAGARPARARPAASPAIAGRLSSAPAAGPARAPR